ncbi:hypothetical protein [Pengzhenrongella sicca]|uniref:Uncharacterized protein n=1 Tax=Pengzhenrongella sicca TaxID=2819238 RepID=A0A8A4ZGR3_9MICO|nr:hypothetical protein [Pengzhenrongella sicca]QTE28838.1 hypothetical protein J4E96_16110 [Pengzhenrongella sicca]
MAGQDLLIDRSVARLAAAYVAAGLAPIRPPEDVDAVLEEIRAAILPLRMPAELEPTTALGFSTSGAPPASAPTGQDRA